MSPILFFLLTKVNEVNAGSGEVNKVMGKSSKGAKWLPKVIGKRQSTRWSEARGARTMEGIQRQEVEAWVGIFWRGPGGGRARGMNTNSEMQRRKWTT